MKTRTERLGKANAARDKANEAYRQKIRAIIPEGCKVVWHHGDHHRCGVVLNHSGFGRVNSIEVRSITGRTYWLDVEKIKRVTP